MTTTTAGKVNLLGLTQPQLEQFFESIGEKRFRAGQVMKWIHHFGVDDFDAACGQLVGQVMDRTRRSERYIAVRQLAESESAANRN